MFASLLTTGTSPQPCFALYLGGGEGQGAIDYTFPTMAESCAPDSMQLLGDSEVRSKCHRHLVS